MSSPPRTVVVTGANGFVGARICHALVERGAQVRAIVRVAGTAPELPGLGEVITRVLLRPLAILGPGASSTWNTLRPVAMREDPRARRANPDQTFPGWTPAVELTDALAEVVAGLSAGPP
jgi:hypothetical protein